MIIWKINIAMSTQFAYMDKFLIFTMLTTGQQQTQVLALKKDTSCLLRPPVSMVVMRYDFSFLNPSSPSMAILTGSNSMYLRITRATLFREIYTMTSFQPVSKSGSMKLESIP
jgi:hypothetical protein